MSDIEDELTAGYRRFRADHWPTARAEYESLATKGQEAAHPHRRLFRQPRRSGPDLRRQAGRTVRGPQRRQPGPAL